MGEAVLFRRVQKLVCDYLRKPALEGTQIGTRIPNPRPSEFIRVLRTGGPKETILSEAAQITVEAWADTKERAEDLLNIARALLNAADETIYGVHEFSGPADLPDPLSSQERFTMSFQVRARGTVINA